MAAVIAPQNGLAPALWAQQVELGAPGVLMPLARPQARRRTSNPLAPEAEPRDFVPSIAVQSALENETGEQWQSALAGEAFAGARAEGLGRIYQLLGQGGDSGQDGLASAFDRLVAALGQSQHREDAVQSMETFTGRISDARSGVGELRTFALEAISEAVAQANLSMAALRDEATARGGRIPADILYGASGFRANFAELVRQFDARIQIAATAGPTGTRLPDGLNIALSTGQGVPFLSSEHIARGEAPLARLLLDTPQDDPDVLRLMLQIGEHFEVEILPRSSGKSGRIAGWRSVIEDNLPRIAFQLDEVADRLPRTFESRAAVIKQLMQDASAISPRTGFGSEQQPFRTTVAGLVGRIVAVNRIQALQARAEAQAAIVALKGMELRLGSAQPPDIEDEIARLAYLQRAHQSSSRVLLAARQIKDRMPPPRR